jgi:putative membrane protein
MSRLSILAPAGLAVVLAVSPLAAQGTAGSQAGSQTGQQTGGSKPREMKPTDSSQIAGERDEDFVKEVAQASEVEIAASKLAVTKASNAEVKAFAQKLIDDHTATGKALATLVKGKNASWPPDDPGMKVKKQKHESLQTLTGAEFDKEYLEDMISDHESTLARVGRQVNGGKDADIKAFATTMQPTLVEHLKMARDLKARLFKQ